jgi:simple sugar transport system ATP-binding protein
VTSTGAPIVELNGIGMRFGTTPVLNDVDFSVAHGEVVALVGDNGAGKSTLVKIVTGYHQPGQGTIRFEGVERRFASPAEARALGIETVYQDLALVDEMPLWRNLFLGKELHRSIGPLRILRDQTMRQTCETLLSEIGLTRFRSPDAYAASLSGGERQSIAIARAMHFGALLLLLDEPTAALSVKETRKVHAAIDSARSRGLGVVLIDHNMSHVSPIADRIVVLQHGRVAAVALRGEHSVDELNELLAQPGPSG